MCKTAVGAIVLVATATLLTGCGSGDTGKDAGRGNGKAHASKSAAAPTADSDAATRTVTLQVSGTGTTQILYNTGDSNGFGNQKLPWTRTATLQLDEVDRKVGVLVSVVPGSVQAANGMLKMASCVIKVDGKQVADNNGGKDGKPCEYKVR
ncbi:hypothetical protein J2Z21_006005 [Streptomyces griseochromogenes]|uniref:MmpS family membrane protein n=1 Tax=Streptomyces griseochromogenes TaxID=68214 RepID=A0A1B1ASJ6_9ACTN|nr:hypothetical protein [Streptomyces griseochromogenes]ANP49543.1 hypothetical protein AVL59_07925 [Streptomyces griseochromogenes]MBP2053014.1 hypothetical protein [Streptomyces griseochromogenes]